MQNLKMHSYQPAPVATSIPSSMQKGGRGYHHKKGCKCPLCKRGGGDDDDDNEKSDIEMGKSTTKSFNFADDADYNDLDEGEQGKAGGSRRRKHSKKSKKGGKTRKTRRSSRKGRKHGRRTHKRR